jgi:hypothetical protein
LVYVDDLLVLSHQPALIIKSLEDFYHFKEEAERPNRYLGAEVIEWRFPDEVDQPYWALSSNQYVKEAIKNLEAKLAEDNLRLPGRCSTPMPIGYRPEMDTSPLLSDEAINYYQSQISILRWAIELGRIDIYVDVALLSHYLVNPRQGHLEAVYPVFCDADHAGNLVTRRSHTGILIYLNQAPITWYSKAQKTVETSTFGSEFVALCIAVELIEALRYKLRMMGVPLDGPTNLFGDNSSVITNATVPSSTLKKKHNAICYHRVREAVAAKVVRIAYIPTGQNLADMFTKPLGGSKLHEFCKKILYQMG